MYYLDGEEKQIDEKLLAKLIEQKFVSFSANEKSTILQQFKYLVNDLELESKFLQGKTVEERYLIAIRRYIKEYSLSALLEEEDACNIFDFLD